MKSIYSLITKIVQELYFIHFCALRLCWFLFKTFHGGVVVSSSAHPLLASGSGTSSPAVTNQGGGGDDSGAALSALRMVADEERNKTHVLRSQSQCRAWPTVNMAGGDPKGPRAET